MKSLKTLEPELIKEIEQFFVSYNEMRGKKFKPLARKGSDTAKRLIKKHQNKR